MKSCLILHCDSIWLKQRQTCKKIQQSHMVIGSHFEFEVTVFFNVKNMPWVTRLYSLSQKSCNHFCRKWPNFALRHLATPLYIYYSTLMCIKTIKLDQITKIFAASCMRTYANIKTRPINKLDWNILTYQLATANEVISFWG